MVAPTATSWMPTCPGIAVEQAGVRGLDRGRGEDAGGDGAEHPADAVDREDVERVIDLGACPQERGAVAQAAGDETDDQRAARRHEARRRGDRHEPGDRAAGGPDDADLARVGVAREDPGDRRRGGRDVGDGEGAGGQAAGGQRGAGVEAEPAEPQQPGAEDGHRHVMRLGLLAVHGASPDHQRDDQRGDARADVDDRAAGEVERAELEQPAVASTTPSGRSASR